MPRSMSVSTKTRWIWARSSRPSRSRVTPSSVDALERGDPAIILFDVDGMTCATCAVRIERVLSRHEGVASVSVNLAGATAAVRVDPGVAEESLVEAVGKIGYRLAPRDQEGERRDVVDMYSEEERTQRRRFLI